MEDIGDDARISHDARAAFASVFEALASGDEIAAVRRVIDRKPGPPCPARRTSGASHLFFEADPEGFAQLLRDHLAHVDDVAGKNGGTGMTPHTPLVTLRPYCDADADALSAIYRAAVRSTGARDYTPAQVEAWAALTPPAASYRRRAADGRLVWIAADSDDHALAYADLEPQGAAIQPTARFKPCHPTNGTR